METKHTPGPWDVTGEVRLVGDPNSSGAWNLYCADVNPASEPEKYLGTICNIQSADHVNGISREEAEANGRLIAAAPDLLEALKGALDRMEGENGRSEYGFDDAILQARAAIAKAEGAQ